MASMPTAPTTEAGPAGRPGRGRGGNGRPDRRADALTRCAGDPARFVAEYFARAPLHRPGADPAAFADLLTLADVDHIVSSTAPRQPAFRMVKDGKPLPPGSYTRSARIGSRPAPGLADPGRVWDEFAAGATLVLQGVHRYWPPLTRFCRDLELALTHPVQVNVYATPPASQGLGIHHDPHDVFVLQVHGGKRWDVYGATPGGADQPPLIATGLVPGDCLYIPRSFPHEARTAESASVHLTIGILGRTWADVVRAAVSGVVDELAGQPLPVGWAEDPAGLAAGVTERLAEVGRRVAGLDAAGLAEREAERFWLSRPPLLEGQLGQVLDLDAVDDDAVVRRRPGAVCRIAVDGDRLRVVLGDRVLHMPARLERAVRAVAGEDAGDVTVGDLAPHLDGPGRLVLARRLIREGLLERVAEQLG